MRYDARAHGKILRAGVHALRGDLTRSIPLLDEAARICDGSGMTLRAACARLRMGELMGSEAGRVLAGDAIARIAALGIEEPRRWESMYALGYHSEARGS